MTVLRAWRHLHRIRREQAHLLELPQAQHMALVANMNRDPKKSSKPFGIDDFALFKQEQQRKETFLSPDCATTLISLHNDGKLHPLLLSCWREALENTSASAAPPETRALRSDDEAVWIVAPEWEGPNARALVCVDGFIHGPVQVRDVDRPLLTYTFEIPCRRDAAGGWIRAGELLLRAT
jgi:hypothetical protein